MCAALGSACPQMKVVDELCGGAVNCPSGACCPTGTNLVTISTPPGCYPTAAGLMKTQCAPSCEHALCASDADCAKGQSCTQVATQIGTFGMCVATLM